MRVFRFPDGCIVIWTGGGSDGVEKGTRGMAA